MKDRAEAIEVEVDGELYYGSRVVTTGDRGDLRQSVRFIDLRQEDPKTHRLGDEPRMDAVARVILRDLVVKWREREQERRTPMKVRPRTKTRRRRRRRA